MDEVVSKDDNHVRASLQVVQRAVNNGWKIPPEAMATVPVEAYAIATDPGRPERDRLRAMELLKALAKDNLDAAVALDKIERLDNGDPTENTATSITLSFDQGG